MWRIYRDSFKKQEQQSQRCHYRHTGPYILTLVVALVSAVACSGTQSNPNSQTQEEGAKRGGTLIYPIVADPSTLNPAITTSVPATYTACKIYEGLTRVNSNLRPEPNLAASWDISSNGRTYTFQLHQNVRWQDGEPFTSEDVKWSLLNVNAQYGPRVVEPFKRIEEIRTPNANTVVITLNESYGPLLKLLNCANAPILPKHIYAGTDILENPHNKENPVGTGPFELKEWTHGDHLTLVRNEDYWRESRPYLDRIVMKIVPSPQATIQQLRGGQVDAVPNYALDKSALKSLQNDPNYKTVENAGTPTNNLLTFNTRSAPLDDPQIRQAITMAINREAIVQRAYLGFGEPGHSAIDTRLKDFYNPDVDYTNMYPYNPKKARQALAKAGLRKSSEGPRVQLTLAYEQASPGFKASVQLIRENLAAVGIDVTLEPMQRSVMLEEVFEKNNFDLYFTRYTTSGDPAIGVQRIYICDAVGAGPFTNASGYCNERVDEQFARGASAHDTDERAKAYFKVQELLAQELPSLVVQQNSTTALVNGRVHGISNGADAYGYWEQVWVSQK